MPATVATHGRGSGDALALLMQSIFRRIRMVGNAWGATPFQHNNHPPAKPVVFHVRA